MPKITPPDANVPVGVVTVNGKDLDVRQHPEFVRFFFDLLRRVGGTDALSNTQLAALITELDDTNDAISVIRGQVAGLLACAASVGAAEMTLQSHDLTPVYADVMQGVPATDFLAGEAVWQH